MIDKTHLKYQSEINKLKTEYETKLEEANFVLKTCLQVIKQYESGELFSDAQTNMIEDLEEEAYLRGYDDGIKVARG